MGEREKFEENKLYNKPFLTAFDYFAKILANGSQAGMAELIHTKSSRISEFRSGKKRVSEDTMYALNDATGGKIFKEYLLGNSQVMLVENVTVEEYAEADMRKNNPDYDVMKARSEKLQRDMEEGLFKSRNTPLDNSFLIEKEVQKAKAESNRIIALLEKQVALLEKEVADKDKQLADKDQQLADKAEIIMMQKRRISELEGMTVIYEQHDPLRDYPYPTGSAEPSEKDSVRV